MSIDVMPKKVILKIEQDTDSRHPRKEFDQYTTFVDWHRRENIGDRKATDQEMEALHRGGFKLLERYLRRYEGAVMVRPVGLLDHSGWHIWLGGGSSPFDPGGWDSGTVGFIYVTRDQLKELGTEEDHIEDLLEGDIKELDQYFQGDVWGYTIETEDGEYLDSCWGFYGLDYCKEEAEGILAGIIKENGGMYVAGDTIEPF